MRVRVPAGMKVRIPKKEVHALQLLKGAIDNSGNVPILSGILIEANKNEVRFSATDLNVSLSIPVKAEVEEEGKTVVSGTKLLRALLVSSADEIELSLKETSLSITAGRSRYSLSVMNADEFPELNFSNSRKVELRAVDFLYGLRTGAFAHSRDSARYVLNGFHLKTKENTLEVVSSDGHRLALVNVPVDKKESDFSVTVARQGIPVLKGILTYLNTHHKDATVSLSDDESKLQLEVETENGIWRATFSLLEGEYPDYERVIPEEKTLEVEADRNELQTALKELSVVFAGEKGSFPIVQMELIAPDRLKLTVKDREAQVLDEAEVEIPISSEGSLESPILLPLDHLRDGVSKLNGENLAIRILNEVSPVTVVSEVGEKYVLMPLVQNA